MGKKLKAALISALLCLAIFSFIEISFDIIENVSGEVFYVNTTGSGGAFTSIQDAINASKDGDTVFVYNGTYYEHVVVNKTINLTGEDRDTTQINGGEIGDVIRITADWVNVSGFTIIKSGSLEGDAGLQIDSYFNNISSNRIANNKECGIYLRNSSGNKIAYNIVYFNDVHGLYLESCNGNIVFGNNVTNSWYGISLSHSNENNIIGNNISKSRMGVDIYYSNRNNIRDNIASNNYVSILHQSSCENNITGNKMTKEGIFIKGESIEHWNTHNIDTSNSINGKPVYYLKNIIGGVIPFGIGQIILANCTNVKIENQELTYSSVGIELGFSINNYISNNNVSFNNRAGIYLEASNRNIISYNNFTYNFYSSIYLGDGIYLESSWENNLTGNNVTNNIYGMSIFYSNNNNIIYNKITANHKYGMYVYYSDKNNINNNNASFNGYEGIAIYYSNSNLFINNSFSSNNDGISLRESDENTIINNHGLENKFHGITLTSSNKNKIIRNNASKNNYDGIHLYSSSTFNIIMDNQISFNGNYGIILFYGPTNNSIYYNSILGNPNQARDDRSDNYWDNGYPLGGNYWSDYTGVDYFKGPNQDQPGSDGFGDTPYIIDSNSSDKYPLIEPYIYKPLENYMILKQGWNLFSIPLIQNKQSLTKVLEMIDGYYDAVQWYDPTDQDDPWKHHKVGKPFGNDLGKLNETIGFWIHITQPGDTIFLYNGTQPTSNQTIQLYPGWNLVGYPSLTSYNRTEGLNNLTFGTHVDSIWTFDAETQKWKELGSSDYFEIGRGYWIHAKVKCEWEVPL